MSTITSSRARAVVRQRRGVIREALEISPRDNAINDQCGGRQVGKGGW